MKRLLTAISYVLLAAISANAAPKNSILFVTQIPIPRDFATVNATFANHSGAVDSRGFGDLWIRYPDGTTRNLTEAAGFGMNGQQSTGAIAVRDPAVHWSGQKALFSMVIGAPSKRYEVKTFTWQLYEISQFGKDQTPVITKVANQPAFNNVMPIYGSDDDKIFFVSDRPRNGEAHLYPQRDEYESTATNTGIWRLSVSSGDLRLLDHAPSGDFHPFIDSFGRLLWTRWDHLQRDQQADTETGGDKGFGAFNYSDESAAATKLNTILEYFPEHQDAEAAKEFHPTINAHRFNHFFPWMMNQDGTELETLNHLGRHELHGYIQRSFNNDPSLDDFYGQYSRENKNVIENFFHIKEDPGVAGRYFGIDCPEFGTHNAGQIVRMDAPPTTLASKIKITYVTHRATASSSDNPSADHSGLYRNPLPLSDGGLIASHTTATQQDSNIGSSAAPQSKYKFRIKTLTQNGAGFFVPSENLTQGISKTISYWSPDELISYSGEMWELQPVEVMARTVPVASHTDLPAVESGIFSSLGVSLGSVQEYLRKNNAAIVIGRDVTVRDSLDIQQPFNLKIDRENGKQTVGGTDPVSLIKHLQFFQGDQIRGYGSSSSTGRRVLAVPMHETVSLNLANTGGPVGSVPVFADGSYAAIVPARRAVTWQLTDGAGNAVVRERYWLTFQPGEVRVCTSCHGITSLTQDGKSEPVNAPMALTALLGQLGNLPPPPEPTAPPEGTNPPASGYSISVADTGKKRGKTAAQVTITSSTSHANETIAVRIKVGAVFCSKKPRNVVLNSDGAATIKMVIGSGKRMIKGSTAILNGKSVVTSNTFTIKNRVSARGARQAVTCSLQ